MSVAETAVGALGERLATYRRRAGLTQEELATLAGLSVAGLRDIEQGRVAAPRPRTLRRLGAVLGLSASETADLSKPGAAEPPASGQVWIGILGPLTVRVDGEEVDPGSEVQRTLLGLLALSPNTPVARERLLPRLAAAGRLGTDGSLAARVSRLRRRLRPSGAGGGPTLTSAAGGYTLLASGEDLDLLAFLGLVRQARRHHGAGELVQAWERYAQAVALWRGEPLAGVTALADAPAVVSLVRQWPTVAAEFAEVGAALGRYEELVPVLRRVVAADPLHEGVHARLILALAGTGRQAEALAVYDSLRRRLDRDLGTTPGPELVEAHRRVLRQELARPAVAAVRAVRTLPSDHADFTGREEQLRWLSAQLPAAEDGPADEALAGSVRRAASSPAVIITVEGMAGVGKTHLALHFAHQLLAAGRYAGQQLYADLSSTPDPAAVLDSWLRLLGVSAERIPAGLAERAALYRDRLRGCALVLLDDAASAEQVAPLLPGGPGSLALLTSRRTLDLAGARVLALDLFPPPEATALLAEVLGPDRVAAEPAAAGRLVAACGHLPLAVGLVARRLQARPEWRLADVAERLADPGWRLAELRAGDRSVRAAFDRDYLALPPELRRDLCRLADRSAAEFTVELAAARLGSTPAAARLVIERLRRAHLVAQSGAGGYRLHNLLSDYLREAAMEGRTP